jgi:hypothetical protein
MEQQVDKHLMSRWDPDTEFIAESDADKVGSIRIKKQCPYRYKQCFGSALVSKRIRIQHFCLHVLYHQKRRT